MKDIENTFQIISGYGLSIVTDVTLDKDNDVEKHYNLYSNAKLLKNNKIKRADVVASLEESFAKFLLGKDDTDRLARLFAKFLFDKNDGDIRTIYGNVDVLCTKEPSGIVFYFENNDLAEKAFLSLLNVSMGVRDGVLANNRISKVIADNVICPTEKCLIIPSVACDDFLRILELLAVYGNVVSPLSIESNGEVILQFENSDLAKNAYFALLNASKAPIKKGLLKKVEQASQIIADNLVFFSFNNEHYLIIPSVARDDFLYKILGFNEEDKLSSLVRDIGTIKRAELNNKLEEIRKIVVEKSPRHDQLSQYAFDQATSPLKITRQCYTTKITLDSFDKIIERINKRYGTAYTSNILREECKLSIPSRLLLEDESDKKGEKGSYKIKDAYWSDRQAAVLLCKTFNKCKEISPKKFEHYVNKFLKECKYITNQDIINKSVRFMLEKIVEDLKLGDGVVDAIMEGKADEELQRKIEKKLDINFFYKVLKKGDGMRIRKLVQALHNYEEVFANLLKDNPLCAEIFTNIKGSISMLEATREEIEERVKSAVREELGHLKEEEQEIFIRMITGEIIFPGVYIDKEKLEELRTKQKEQQEARIKKLFFSEEDSDKSGSDREVLYGDENEEDGLSLQEELKRTIEFLDQQETEEQIKKILFSEVYSGQQAQSNNVANGHDLKSADSSVVSAGKNDNGKIEALSIKVQSEFTWGDRVLPRRNSAENLLRESNRPVLTSSAIPNTDKPRVKETEPITRK
ncbi:MAG: hypothetical protein K0R98_1216 [Rickettsiaceae bacterium]|jgi:hypothetical protein|nr:hypothetical protein [Rickettsiaceae bacterium]